MSHKAIHAVGGADHSASTLAEFNTKISDATLGPDIAIAQEVYVSSSGNDTTGDGSEGNPYKTLAKANTSITDSSSSKPYIIKMGPGLYSEAPLTLKTYVRIEGRGKEQTFITTTTPGSVFLSLLTGCGVSSLSVSGATTSTGIALTSIGASVSIEDVKVTNCLVCIDINADSAITFLKDISISNSAITDMVGIKVQDGRVSIHFAELTATSVVSRFIQISGTETVVDIHDVVSVNDDNLTYGIHISGGAKVQIVSSVITGIPGGLVSLSALYAEGVNTNVIAQGCVFRYAATGVRSHGCEELKLLACGLMNCVTGLYSSGTNASIVSVSSCDFFNNSTWDVLQDNSNATIIGSGILKEELKSITAGEFIFSYMSATSGDEAMAINAELAIGTPEVPRESVFGEGDSYVRGMLGYTYNGTVYADISTAMASVSGSTFTFPNNSVNTAIYVSSDLVVKSTSDYHKFFGIKMLSTIAQSGGTIVAEYWNGTAWVHVHNMTAQSGGKYYRKAETLFENAAGSYQVRYNPFIGDDWTKNDPITSGTNRYWARFRITSSPTTLPTFEQFKLHASRNEKNADGFEEDMGLARAYVSFPISFNMFKDAGTVMGAQDLWFTTNTKAGMDNNVFNSNGDSVGHIFALPSWADTSAPLKVLIAVQTVTLGDLTMKAFMSKMSTGDTWSSSDPASTTGEITDTVVKTMVADEITWFEFNLDISSYGIEADGVNPDIICVNIEADTIQGNVWGGLVNFSMLEWRKGEHI